MPLLRASIVIAVIFALSPTRDQGRAPVGPAPERVAAPAVQPTIESLIRDSAELRTRAAHGYEDAAAARDAWRTLPPEAQDALARLVANELRSGIDEPNR